MVVNGKMDKDMEKVNRSGMMEVYILATGKMIKPMDKVD